MKLEIFGDKVHGFSGHGESDATDALEPCPFCGGTEVAVENTHTPSYWAECGGCGAHGPTGRAADTGRPRVRRVAERRHREAFAEAVRLWNQRAALAAAH